MDIDIMDPTALVVRSTSYASCSNPTDPDVIDNCQAGRTAMFWFESASTIQISLQIGNGGTYGRNFVFGGQVPTLLCTPDAQSTDTEEEIAFVLAGAATVSFLF